MAIYLSVLSLIVTAMVIYNFPRAPKWLKNGALVFSCLLLALVSGLRYNIGTDYMNYMWMYDEHAFEDPITIYEKPALHLIGRISKFIFNHYATWFIIMALLTISLFFFGIKKYSVNVTMSVFLFIFLGVWHGSFNTVKQHAAAAIFFASFPFLYKKDFLSWMFSCVLATFFHEAALIMIPAYFMFTLRGKYSTYIILAVGFMAIVGKEVLIILVNLVKGVDYLSSDGLASESVGILRVLASCAPLSFYLLFCQPSDYFAHEMIGENVKDFEHKEDQKFRCLLNNAIFSTALTIAFMNSIYFMRFTIFFEVFNVLFVPYLVKTFNKEKKNVFTVLILALYCVFWWVDITKASTVNYQWVFMIKE